MRAVIVLVLLLASARVSAETRKPSVARRANPRTGLYEPRMSELVRAVQRGDKAEIARMAQRIGPARLDAALRGGAEDERAAALVAIPTMAAAPLLLEALTELVSDHTKQDAKVATSAAAAMAAFLSGGDPEALERWDVAPDMVAAACAGLKRLPYRPGLPPALKEQALDAVLGASATCGGLGDQARLASDPDASVRRAVALVVPATAPGGTAALKALVRDPSPSVAAAATSSLCRPAAGQTLASPIVKAPEYREVLESARRLAVAPATSVPDAVEMLACVAAAGTPADTKLLEQLAQQPASPLAERASSLLGGREKQTP